MNIWVQCLFIFFNIIILMARICTDFVLLGHSCGCRCLSGTFVMVFCAARTQPGTNRGDPPLPATNRWMSEGGRLGNRISFPLFGRKKETPKQETPARFFFLNRSGSERDGRWAASICSETATFCVGACVCLRRAAAMTHPDKRGARSGRAPPLPPVCSAVAASFCYETSEHTPLPLWFTLFLLIAQALTPARMEPEQSWYICGVKESRLPFFLALSFSLSFFGRVT